MSSTSPPARRWLVDHALHACRWLPCWPDIKKWPVRARCRSSLNTPQASATSSAARCLVFGHAPGRGPLRSGRRTSVSWSSWAPVGLSHQLDGELRRLHQQGFRRATHGQHGRRSRPRNIRPPSWSSCRHAGRRIAELMVARRPAGQGPQGARELPHSDSNTATGLMVLEPARVCRASLTHSLERGVLRMLRHCERSGSNPGPRKDS